MNVVPQPIRNLQPLLEGIAVPSRDCELTDLTQDSRTVGVGSLFLACAGRTTHGLAFAAQAVAQGARAILWEPTATAPRLPEFPSDIIVTPVAALSQRAGEIADRFFGAPSAQLAVTGVTGTNGKTTTAYLLAQAWTFVGASATYMGTIGVGAPGALKQAQLTTADAVTVQRELAAMHRAGVRHAVMEVSSHALDQHRVAGVRFRVALFTNLTRDHLDYHGSMAAYGAVKARLLQHPELSARIINVDDAFGVDLAKRPAQPGHLVVTSGTHSGQRLAREFPAVRYVCATASERTVRGLSLSIDSSWGSGRIDTSLVGDFNVDNILLVLAALLDGGVDLSVAAQALAQVASPPGRMQRFGGAGDAPLVLVDYAHTPDALAKALRAARAHCRDQLLVVFGCGGDRDSGKRPLMGAVAADLADLVILTDDNPRTESPAAIVADIRSGWPSGAAAGRQLAIVHDRRAAIATAIERASADDVVLVAGKGHENYQLYRHERRLFSDASVVEDCLRIRHGVVV
ncbi:MAG: UDP-N-acetylmuramoyl-L-alanyl-D-glutamate--2,6-diaminopimelate ligase [Steroidobacteraceae bacterium]